jgi:hypothetical protein
MSFSSPKHNVKNNYRLIAFELRHITTEEESLVAVVIILWPASQRQLPHI